MGYLFVTFYAALRFQPSGETLPLTIYFIYAGLILARKKANLDQEQ